MTDDNLLDEIVAELGALLLKDESFHREITAMRIEIDELKTRATSADVDLGAIKKDAEKLRGALGELRSNAAQMRADAAQLRADETQQVADRALEDEGDSPGARTAQIEASESQDWADRQQDSADSAQRKADDSY